MGDRADEVLRDGVLPGAAGGRENFLDLHALHALAERVAVNRIAIAEDIGGGGVLREGVHDLLSGPRRGRMLGDVNQGEGAISRQSSTACGRMARRTQ
jgi:hypothetical protein